MAAAEAPGRLETVQAFVNTVDLEGGEDDLGSPGDLAGWLVEHGLMAADEEVGPDDLDRARRLREAIRSLAEHNAGEHIDPELFAVLDEVADGARFTLRLRPEGTQLEPRTTGPRAAFGQILGIVADAMAEGTWARMKSCRRDSCRWMFYDRSRNRSGSWCSMRVCGNREKAKAFRDRHGVPSAS